MSDLDNRGSVIEAVKNPLGFLVLGMLVVEGTIAALAVSLEKFQGPLVWTLIISVFLFIATVVILAVWRPEALKGSRPLQEIHANQFASDLFLALDGALSNLEPAERVEAWLTVADVIESGGDAEGVYSLFCTGVAKKLTQLTSLQNRRVSTQGLLEVDG